MRYKPASSKTRSVAKRRRARRFLTIAGLALAALLTACADVRLIATPTTTPSPPTATAVAPPSLGLVFPGPRCGQYDDYQGSAMAFYSLSAIVQDGLDSAAPEADGETLDSAVARFEVTVRRALAGEAVVPGDPIEQLALLWIASDGCMR